jgi:hypothetical protein
VNIKMGSVDDPHLRHHHPRRDLGGGRQAPQQDREDPPQKDWEDPHPRGSNVERALGRALGLRKLELVLELVLALV